jgi:chaperonin GroEL (HSP60 family)
LRYISSRRKKRRTRKMTVTTEDLERLNSLAMPKLECINETTSINTNRDNVVSEEKLQNIYLKTLRTIAGYLANTFGPMGSNTKLIRGNNAETVVSEYTKDGHKVLKHILFSNPIEMSIQAEMVDITHHVEMEVGDGTTSAVILSSKIYEYLVALMEEKTYQPYQIIYAFKNAVSHIQELILSKGTTPTLDDIYDICFTSTNGNKEISHNIKSIYEQYGLDVQIDVSISTTKENMIKVYDGLTVTEGYSDPAYINNRKNATAEIHNPNIYAFLDPVDTMDMISLFEKIIMENIIEPIQTGEQCVPTVIISPKMSRDMSSLMQTVVEMMHQAADNQKPPLLVITDISGSDEGIYLDIARLCGCKYIRKYIDPEIKKADEAKGLAASIENVCSFAGHAELVVSDIGKTKFINPAKMLDEEGNPSADYTSLINYLQSELDNARANGEDSRSVGNIRKRLRSLKANMVEFLVGGITIADRDADRDLVIDAVKNCASAIENGVGRAANFEGFIASAEYAAKLLPEGYSSDHKYSLAEKIALIIFHSYEETLEILFDTSTADLSSDQIIKECIFYDAPMNLRTNSYDGSVKSSIMSDVKILEAISKLITIMGTSNQCLLQAPQLNTY